MKWQKKMVLLLSLLFKKVREGRGGEGRGGEGREHLIDIMALGVGSYLVEGAYYSVGACSKKYRILLGSNEKKDEVSCFVSLN